MMKIFTLLFLVCAAACISCTSWAQEDNGMFLADPFVLESDGMFYIYGTSARDGITVYKSIDLRTWEGPCGATEGLALHKNDSWGDSRFWAPEVYNVLGKYLMTYSVDEHIAYAWADSPVGPFVNEKKVSYLDEKGIDSHIFIDNGSAYMFWVRFDGGNVIFEAKMDDLEAINMKSLQRIIDVRSGTWEKTMSNPVANVAEGPFVIRHNGTYYLTYSCNHFQSPDYAVGYATARDIKGPWTRYGGNPIIHNHGGYRGTGHHALLETESGKIYMIYHAHYSGDRVAPRRTLISPVEFQKDLAGGPDILTVSDEIIVPVISRP